MHRGNEQGQIDRLRQMLLEAAGNGAGAVLVAGMSRKGDRRDLAPGGRWQLSDTPDERVTILARHANVDNQDVGLQVR